MKSDKTEATPVIIGWREWVSFPDWNVPHLKAKVDTGARTSSLHVSEMVLYDRDDSKWARFVIHPWQGSDDDPVTVETPVLSVREVRSSSGLSEQRPVILCKITVAGIILEAEITLTNRAEMGFRMLLGREAIRGGFSVVPGKSYLSGRPGKDIRRKNRGR